ncbi:MAG: hypothetical protein ACI3W5_06650 [Faecousia sp.]
MKKLIALLLCLVMVMGLMTACGGDSSSEKGIVGTWTATVKLSDMEGMEDTEGMEEYFDFDKMSITVNLKFAKDGTYALSFDQKSVDKLVDQMVAGMEKLIEDMAKEMNMTTKDILDLYGASSVKEFVETSGMLDEFDELRETQTGEYTWDEATGVLTLDGDETDAELKGNTLTMDLDGMELTLKRK